MTLAEACQPAVGRRAAAASLRGVELDQGGGTRARLGSALPMGVRHPYSEYSHEKKPHADWSKHPPPAYGRPTIIGRAAAPVLFSLLPRLEPRPRDDLAGGAALRLLPGALQRRDRSEERRV